MLSKFDDYPIHQTSKPIFHTATSDRFTYDRTTVVEACDVSVPIVIGVRRFVHAGRLLVGATVARTLDTVVALDRRASDAFGVDAALLAFLPNPLDP